jgi:hypothetical protein
MRVTPAILPLLALAIIGCARKPMRVPELKLPPRPVPQPALAALAFTPSVARDVADDVYLDRQGRGSYASAGFESLVVSETYVRQDDRMRMDRFGDSGTFERRAISTTVTVRQR